MRVPNAADMALRCSRIVCASLGDAGFGHPAIHAVSIINHEGINPYLGQLAVSIARAGIRFDTRHRGNAWSGRWAWCRCACRGNRKTGCPNCRRWACLCRSRSAQHMRARAHHCVGASIDRGVKQRGLEIGRLRIIGAGRFVGPVQCHGLEWFCARIHIARGLMRVDGEQHEPRMGARRLPNSGSHFHHPHRFPSVDRLVGEDLIAQPHMMRVAADIERAADLAHRRELAAAIPGLLRAHERADANTRLGVDAEARHRWPAIAMGGKVEAVSTSATRVFTMSR